MPFARRVFWYNTKSAPTAAFNIGPYTLPAGSKLFSVRVVANSAEPLVTAPSTAQLTTGPIWGVQYVLSGNPPLDIVGGADSQQWLWNHYVWAGGFGFAWAPSSDNGVIGLQDSFDETWRGQLVLEADADFYLSFGDPFGIGEPVPLIGSFDFLSSY